MKRLILFSLLAAQHISCSHNPSTSTDKTESKLPSDTAVVYPRHPIHYDDPITLTSPKLRFDTTNVRFHSKDTIVGYRINQITKQVLRLCAQKNDREKVSYLLSNQNRIEWNPKNGLPHEFIGPYLFSDIYRGGDNGGDITKMKFRLTNNRVEYLDSITGGGYSEGAGTWEWLLSNTGEPQMMLDHPGNLISVNNDLLLVTDGPTTLIDLPKKDTLLTISNPGMEFRHQVLFDKGMLFSGQTEPRLGFLRMYDLKGKILWNTKADYLDNLLLVPGKNLIITSGYYFPSAHNTQYHFTAGYDSQTGAMLWSSMINNVVDAAKNPITHTSFATEKLFVIGDDIYAMLITEFVQNSPDPNNQLILFNRNGEVYGMISLSKNKQNYSVITYGDGKFELVSNDESRKFRVYH